MQPSQTLMHGFVWIKMEFYKFDHSYNDRKTTHILINHSRKSLRDGAKPKLFVGLTVINYS
ncbi:hypothetical protein LINPERHAP2_LOCUS37902 [Linum perenne]